MIVSKKKIETTVDTLTGLWFFDLLGSFFLYIEHTESFNYA